MSMTPLPFEYETRYGDQYADWGIPIEQAALLEERDRQLEDHLAGVRSTSPIIDLGDAAVLVGYTKAFWVERPSVLRMVVATVSYPGLTDTVADIIKDGVSFDTMTIPAGELLVKHPCSVSFEADSMWQMYQSSAGSGALGLTYYGIF